MRNFGGNLHFTPRQVLAPRSEAEVLEILDRHVHQRVRAVGSLYSWSDVAATEGVALDLRHLDTVELAGDGAASVGAGCVVERLLATLAREADATLPALGNIAKQTIAGAISTATHGSGRASMSHYVEGLRLAAYDPQSGRARIYELEGDGPELRAARCALGCMGIILSVRTRIIPQYHIEDSVRGCATLDEVLATGEEYPLQMFALFPYRWSYLVFQRRVARSATRTGTSRSAPLLRLVNRVGTDFLSHLLLKHLLLRAGSPRLVRAFYRKLAFRLMPKYRTVTDRSTEVLMLKHDLFRHEEMEVFVPASRIREVTGLVRHVTAAFAGVEERMPAGLEEELQQAGMLDALRERRGTYTHHYPIAFRRVLPDDALISMTGGVGEPYYSLSFFTYFPAGAREGFYRYAAFLARALTRLHGGRLHWGKHFPLRHEEIAPGYPRLGEFREICRRVDPAGVFLNAYAERVLGFTGS